MKVLGSPLNESHLSSYTTALAVRISFMRSYSKLLQQPKLLNICDKFYLGCFKICFTQIAKLCSAPCLNFNRLSGLTKCVPKRIYLVKQYI